MEQQTIKASWLERAKRSKLFWLTSLALVPLVVAGLYALSVNVHAAFRYDGRLFTPEYQERYSSPGIVALELEQALRSGDSAKFTELTGLRSSPALEANPDVVFTILLAVDEQDYFHYLYLDMQTLRRQTHYIKEINGRWVVTPPDGYFYLDSGQWMRVFGPIATFWWLILLTAAVVLYVFQATARMRTAMGR